MVSDIDIKPSGNVARICKPFTTYSIQMGGKGKKKKKELNKQTNVLFTEKVEQRKYKLTIGNKTQRLRLALDIGF